jgi:hypothetical protein
MPTLTYEYPVGNTRQGTYSVSGHPKVMEVTTEFGTRVARVEETPPEVLARMVARELAREAAARYGSRSRQTPLNGSGDRRCTGAS